MKGHNLQTGNNLNDVIDKFAKTHNNEQINKMEMKRKDPEPKVIKAVEDMDTEHNESLPQSIANNAMDK